MIDKENTQSLRDEQQASISNEIKMPGNYVDILISKTRSTPYWLIAAILYGISWNLFIDVNLSFIAWFAFVPLFIELEKKNTFRSFYLPAFLFTTVAYLISCHGFFITHKAHLLVIVGGIIEIFMSSIAFALLYPFKKRIGFNKALMLFPFIIALWEWIYQELEFTNGYLMLSHTQARNTILIQYIDIFGVWSIACWVMMFNVLIYKSLSQQPIPNPSQREGRLALSLGRGWGRLFLIMLMPPLCYYGIRYIQINNKPAEQINLTLINTNFSIFIDTYEESIAKLARLISITDSVNYELQLRRIKTDLFVWHEGAVDFGDDIEYTGPIDSAVNKWKTPLLTGMSNIIDTSNHFDQRSVNRAGLFTSGNTQHRATQTYDKIRLAPGNEMVPYHMLLSKIPGLPVPIYDTDFLKAGDSTNLINMTTQKGANVTIGTPICIEQNYSYIWNEMARKGAECFVQLSFEGWWPTENFLRQMADVTRLRCIETRRAAARCSNSGITCFIDVFGNMTARAEKDEVHSASAVTLYTGTSFFSEHENFFPVSCIIIIVLASIFWEIKKYRSSSPRFVKKKPYSGISD